MDTIKDSQHKVRDIVKAFNFNWSSYVQYIHLVEEVGELGEALTVHHGDRKSGNGDQALADHSSVEEEVGDVLFTLTELSNQLNLDLAIVLEKTIIRYKKKLLRLNKGL